MDLFLQCQEPIKFDGLLTVLRPHLLSPARQSGPATLAQEVSTIFGLYPCSLARSAGFFSILYLGKLHWFPYLGLSCFYGIEYLFTVGVRISWKKLRCRDRWWLRCHLVPPTLCSSRKYPYPSPHEGQRILRGERGLLRKLS